MAFAFVFFVLFVRCTVHGIHICIDGPGGLAGGWVGSRQMGICRMGGEMSGLVCEYKISMCSSHDVSAWSVCDALQNMLTVSLIRAEEKE